MMTGSSMPTGRHLNVCANHNATTGCSMPLKKQKRAAGALARSIENLTELRRERQCNSSVESILELAVGTGGPGTRHATEEAFHRYQHAVMELRALIIRSLVDESGSTLSQVARVMCISRQKVTELYRVGRAISDKSRKQEEEH